MATIERILLEIHGEQWELYTKKKHVVLVQNMTLKNAENILGCCNKDSRRIWVDGSLTKEKFEEVLAHELAHAMFWYQIQKMKRTDVQLNEEQVCHFFSDNIFKIAEIVKKIQGERGHG